MNFSEFIKIATQSKVQVVFAAEGITAKANGYIFNASGKRIGAQQAAEILADKGYCFFDVFAKNVLKADGEMVIQHPLTAAWKTEKQPKNVGVTGAMVLDFDRLNAATRAYFSELCEATMAATQDADLLNPARIGKQIPMIGLTNAPRLSNLKKAGVIERVGNKGGYLQITQAGRDIFFASI